MGTRERVACGKVISVIVARMKVYRRREKERIVEGRKRKRSGREWIVFNWVDDTSQASCPLFI